MDRKDLARKRKNNNMANIQLFWPNELSLINIKDLLYCMAKI